MLQAALLVVPMAIDTFVIAAVLGAARLPTRVRSRLALLLAAFEGGMPLVGLAVGEGVGHVVSGVADYLAIAVLVAVGGFMALVEDEEAEGAKVESLARVGVLAALALGVTVSLDELAVGFTLGLLDVPTVPVLVAIAAQAFVAAQAGVRVGARIGEAWREAAERVAGVVLVAMAVWLLAEKLGG